MSARHKRKREEGQVLPRRTRSQMRARLIGKLRDMSPSERTRAIASGRIRLKSGELRISGATRLRVSNCTVIGDNNFVEGDNNVVIGRNNQCAGDGNSLRARLNGSESLSARIVSQITHYFGRGDQAPAEPAPRLPARPGGPTPPQARTTTEYDEEVREKIMPVPGTDARTSVWKKSALDLPGEPVDAGDNPDRECVVCRTNARDTIFEPCHHMVCCRQCARDMAQRLRDGEIEIDCPLKCGKVLYMSIVF